MTQSDDDSTRARVLDLIAEKGPVSAAQLAKVLSLTPAAVRRHITALEDAEQIEVHTPALTGRRGRGRPARHYVLTPKARTSFAEGYSDLANRALRYLSQVAGDKAVDSFAAARGRDLERRYAAVVESAGKDPSERARALADALTLDGYAASVRDVGDGSFAVQLCQGNCPVRDVAGSSTSCATLRRRRSPASSASPSSVWPPWPEASTSVPPTFPSPCPRCASARSGRRLRREALRPSEWKEPDDTANNRDCA